MQIDMKELNEAASAHEDWIEAIRLYREAQVAMKKAINQMLKASQYKYQRHHSRAHRLLLRAAKAWNMVEHKWHDKGNYDPNCYACKTQRQTCEHDK